MKKRTSIAPSISRRLFLTDMTSSPSSTTAARIDQRKLRKHWPDQTPCVKVFHHGRNLKLGGALRTGFGNATIDHGMERPSDVKHSVADVDKTRRAGFRPVFDLVVGLLTTLEFFKEDLGAIEQGRHV